MNLIIAHSFHTYRHPGDEGIRVGIHDHYHKEVLGSYNLACPQEMPEKVSLLC